MRFTHRVNLIVWDRFSLRLWAARFFFLFVLCSPNVDQRIAPTRHAAWASVSLGRGLNSSPIRPPLLRRLMRLSQSPNQPCEPPCGSWSRLCNPAGHPPGSQDLWFYRFTAISPTPDGGSRIGSRVPLRPPYHLAGCPRI